jgi:PAS domain S-box-containing protein
MSESKKPSERAAYADLFEKLLDPLFLLNPENYSILEMNPAAERFLGENYAEWMGRPLQELAQTDQREELVKGFRVSMRRHHPRQFECTWLPAPGSTELRFMELSAGRLDLSDDQQTLQVIARDISEKKKLMEALKDLSLRDPMTGMRNFRYFEQQLQHDKFEDKRNVFRNQA